jgi:hypothetical protein
MLAQPIIEAEKKWAQLVVTNAKSILRRYKKVASGNLVNSITYKVSNNGDISFEYAGEGVYVESGRRRGARFPPPGPILKWIKIKGIKGRDRTTGRFIKDKALVFLIQRAISRDGIEPVPFFQMALDKATQQLYPELEEATATYLESQIQLIFP